MWVSFWVKTKAEHVFFVARDHKMMYTTIECLSVCDGRKNYGSHGKEMSAVSCAGQLRACKETKKRDKV